MSCLLNLLWMIFGGFQTAVTWAVLGLGWCISIIGIPFGLQAFKLARLSLAPFGVRIRTQFERHPIANLIWMILGGFALAALFFLIGILWSITLIGLPVGLQCFKLARLALCPFGATVSG